jgi:two-component system, chemotaxis family, chemotaxis protein CheY
MISRVRHQGEFSNAGGQTADVIQLEGIYQLRLGILERDRTSVRKMDQIRALIVDDSSVMRKIVERSLRQAGLELSKVFEAGNGAEALAVLAKDPVDLILCDINMPVMDGLEFVKKLATMDNLKGIPVVMITTEGSENHVIQALSAGAKGYIRKPFTPDQVKEHVLPVVGKKS